MDAKDRLNVSNARAAELQVEKDNLLAIIEREKAEMRQIDLQIKANNMASGGSFDGPATLEGSQLRAKWDALNKSIQEKQQRLAAINNTMGGIDNVAANYGESVNKEFDQKHFGEYGNYKDYQAARKENFKKVKEEYKKRSVWKRTAERLRGRGPNWKRVKGLTPDQLEYLVKVSKGQTIGQKEQDERSFERRRDEGKHVRDIDKLQSQRHWEQFIQKLQKGPSEYEMERELNSGRTL